jgi:RecB family exonuclease
LPVASPEEARSIALRQNGVEDLVLPHARHAWSVERRREETEPHDEYDGVVGLPLDLRDRVFSASQLTHLGQCPFKWFAGNVLHLAEPEEAEDDLGPRLKGQLYHRALQRGMSGGARDPRQALLDRLEEAFLQAEQELEIPTLPAWEARRAELLSQLRLAVEAPDFVSEGAEVLALEHEFQTLWSGLQIRGVIDRVDRTPEGLLLVDYKTGAQPPPGVKNAEGKARRDIQLPLYQQAAAPALFPGEPVIGAHYFSLAKRVAMKAPVDEAVLDDLVTQVKQRLAAGCYPVDPDVEEQACTYCPFDLVCRRGPRLRRKGMRQ